MKSLLEKGFVYTMAKDTDADYLKEKFRKIREEQEKEKQESASKVQTIKPKIRSKA